MSLNRRLFLLAVLLLLPASSEAEDLTVSDAGVVDAAPDVAPDPTPVEAHPVATDSAPIAASPASAAAAAGGECDCSACREKKAADLKKAVAGAYAPLFYNNNFSYLNNPAYDDWHAGERLKQIPLGESWMLDLGGQFRLRSMHENNFRGLHLNGKDDDFLLQRTRLFLNAKYDDWFRAYAEYIDAESNNEALPPRLIEVNRSDMLNLFADTKLLSGDGDLWFRIGRQELLYGSERLISPLDWANTRRTFEGFKFYWQGPDWNVDFFATRPVVPNPTHFDSADYSQEFFGAWGTYKAAPGQTVDLFAVQYNNDRGVNNYEYTTLGGRWLGSEGSWLWELEGGTQFGENTSGTPHAAGFATVGGGYKWADRDWKPQLWCYYDWASAGEVRGAGQGFNHLFPLAHKYLGFMDLYARSNIQSPNVQLTVQPHSKLKLLAWYYYLFLDTRADTPYTVTMAPVNPGNAPASRDLGHELDLLATISLTPRMDLLLGYSHFFSGDYYQLTPGLPYRGDADFFYAQFHWNF